MKKNLLYYLSFILIAVLNYNSLLAQIIYKPGKIVTNSGDSISGFIGDQKKKHNPDKIFFKDTENSNPVEYFPTDAKAILIEGSDYYKSAIITIDMNYEKTWEKGMTYSKDTIKDTVFLRVIVESKLSLYLYNDENFKDHFYYSLDGKNYFELVHKKISEYSNGIYYDRTIERYKNQLSLLMNDCSQALQKVKYIRYNENPLGDLFVFYNKCNDENIPLYKSESIKNVNKIYALGGVNVSNLKFQAENDFYLEYADFDLSVSPVVGFGVNFSLDRTMNKYSVFIELTWMKFETRANFFYGDFYEYSPHFKWSHLKLISAFQYKFNTQKVRPYIFAGPSISYILSDKSMLRTYNHNPGLLSFYSRENISEDFYKPLKAGYSYLVGTGVSYKDFNFEIRYESASYLKNQIGVKSGVKTFYGILKYYI